MKKHLLIFIFIFAFSHFHIFTFAQGLRISLLTCTPGQALSETFGHSALRVIDSNSLTDNVFNYGTFPFYEKGFYLKFIQGKLKYSVETEPFNEFIYYYQQTNRGITEQVLQLSDFEKKDINQALLQNIKPDNKYYQYDFFLDNCTTRLRDIIEKYKIPKPTLPSVMPTNYTFRNAIHQYLDKNNQPWSKLGIDILLGAKTDAVMTVAQQQFLPDNLMNTLDSTKNVQMVQAKNQVFTAIKTNPANGYNAPFLCSVGFVLLYSMLGFSKNSIIKKIIKTADVCLFLTIGLLGVLLVLMWVGTDHSMTKDNYNLLWASPLYLVFLYFLNKNTKLASRISVGIFIYLILFLCSWLLIPQAMNIALMPIIILLAWRSLVH